MAENYQLKNLINEHVVKAIAEHIKVRYPDFDHNGFARFVMGELYNLELKQRANHIADGFRKFLPEDYPTTIGILMSTFGPELRIDAESGENLSAFYYMPHSQYIERYGLDHLKESIKAIYEITKRFTAEFCVRPYIQKYPDEMLNTLHKWTKDPSAHVRRLVSEGSRTRLPWAGRLPAFIEDPEPVIALLEKLKNDPEQYVRRSVANNLNDIAKDHPERVVKLLKQWQKGATANTDWIIKHASRTLVKQGHEEALQLLGYNPKVRVKLENLRCTPKARLGGKVVFSFKLVSEQKDEAKLIVDFAIHFMKANGKQSPKVFKLGQKTIAPYGELELGKGIQLVQRTTRKLYPGTHTVEILVNGKSMGKTTFELEP